MWSLLRYFLGFFLMLSLVVYLIVANTGERDTSQMSPELQEYYKNNAEAFDDSSAEIRRLLDQVAGVHNDPIAIYESSPKVTSDRRSNLIRIISTDDSEKNILDSSVGEVAIEKLKPTYGKGLPRNSDTLIPSESSYPVWETGEYESINPT